ncbi:MAG TPA: cyclic pyranopterin monophosphate synthase MoaC [Acidimicrobiales bacterium]|nr:cyclic pyranopterin monophosphate synthase MoaC [Acidimicrobiales bacterium]
MGRDGRARMVDVTGKAPTLRRAVARCVVRARDGGRVPGGADEFAEAKVAGVQAAKSTGRLVPLCHPLPLDDVRLEIRRCDDGVEITAETTVVARTGVEMEALTACTVAALSLVGRGGPDRLFVDEVALWHKSGGRSGSWARSRPPESGR